MSWIYSIVFASLFVSSDLNVGPRHTYQNIHAPATVSVIQDETEKFEQSYPISSSGRVRVSNVNGSIEMIAWDRNEVRLEATKIADSKESLADVELRIDARSDSFSVETEYKNVNWMNRRRKVEVHFRVSVP